MGVVCGIRCVYVEWERRGLERNGRRKRREGEIGAFISYALCCSVWSIPYIVKYCKVCVCVCVQYEQCKNRKETLDK